MNKLVVVIKRKLFRPIIMLERLLNDISIYFCILFAQSYKLMKRYTLGMKSYKTALGFIGFFIYITFIYGKHILSDISLILLLQHEFYSSLLRPQQYHHHHVFYSHQVSLLGRHPICFD